MAYRNGTYIAFAADGQTDPTKSDIKYYNILKGWNSMKSKEFTFINAHDKVSAVRDTSKAETIKKSLRERLNNSKNFLLLVGNTTRFDDDFVPYELTFAIDRCSLPVIVCYVNHHTRITGNIPSQLANLWPQVLRERMVQSKVKTIHIPFRESVILQAINGFDVRNQPAYSIGLYIDSIYNNLGIE